MIEEPADLQKAWHIYFGSFIKDSSILDIGSGQGFSKSRLSEGNNKITTSDVNRSLMTKVDRIEDVRDIPMDIKFDYVTAFDVIEHVSYLPEKFIASLYSICTKGIVFTTPRRLLAPHPWHYEPEHIVEMVEVYQPRLTWFVRIKSTHLDEIRKVDFRVFLKETYTAMGVMIRK